jgi:ribosomal subunit interface protein
VRHNLQFKNFSPSHRLRELVEDLIVRLDRHAPNSPADTIFLRLFVDENVARRLYHVSLTCDVPGRMLAAQEERHDAEEAVREAFTEIERQLEKHKVTLSHSYLYKRPARREGLRNMKAEAAQAEERGRELFSTLAERHLKRLYNFVRREIAYYLATGDLPPGGVTAEDVVDAALLQAYHEFVKDTPRREIRNWLIELAVEKVEAEVKRSKAERAGRIHIEEDIPETPPTEEVSTPGGEAALTILGTAADVEVPAVFRNAVIEKYKKLEEADNV